MGWQDRSYSSRGPEGSGASAFFQKLLFGSFSLGTWFDVHIRVHSMLIVMMVANVLFAGRGGVQNAVTGSLILFGVILLHEFGHCIAARRVGGSAHDILLWPLGGLAFVNTPRRPWPTFVATAGGPLVNLIICALCGTALWIMHGSGGALPINPLLVFGGDAIVNDASFRMIDSSLAYYLWWIDSVSWTLFVFNMLPIFPMDAGRILQTALWPKLGYHRATDIACTVGLFGAVAMGLVGLGSGQLLLVFLGISCFMTCQQTRLMLRQNADEAYADEYYAAPLTTRTRSNRAPQKRPFGPNPLAARRVVPRDDKRTLRDLNPLEWIARRRRKKQFERLMRDD